MGQTTPLVLIVAAGDRARARLSAPLVQRGWLVVAAETGDEAIDRAARHEPDVIVLDLLLPDACGLDLARRLHDDARARPILALAAHRPDAYRRLAAEAGCAALLSTNVAGDDLAGAIRAVLAGPPAVAA
jgi:DNA-binding NarL/FixJ family response regulator